MHCSVRVRGVGQSRCRYRRRAVEYEYRTLARPEYEYEGILFRDGLNLAMIPTVPTRELVLFGIDCGLAINACHSRITLLAITSLGT